MSAIVVLTSEQLQELVDRAVAKAVVSIPQSGAREILSLKQAADFLDRAPRTVTELVKTRGLPAHYISDREPKFIRSELVAWLANLPAEPTEKGES